MQGGGDQDLRELVLDLQRQVSELAVAVRELQLGSATSERWDLVDSASASAVPPLPARVQLQSEPPTTPPRTTAGGYHFDSSRSSPKTPSSVYNSLAAEIPPCPEFCLRLANSLRGPAEEIALRAKRAWEIGYWARYTLEGRVRVPRPSVAIQQANTVYVVLRAPGFDCPIYCVRAGDYRYVVKDFSEGTISHGFPSQAEARIYCHGAGVQFPSQPSSWR